MTFNYTIQGVQCILCTINLAIILYGSVNPQDKPMCFRPNPVHRLMYDICMYHMMNKIKV